MNQANAQKLKLYDVWKKEGHKFSLNLYMEFLNYCVIEALFDAAYCDKAFAIVEDIKADGYVPDISIYTSLIQTCARAKQVERAFEVKKLVEDLKIGKTQHTHMALIRALALSSLPDSKERAKKVFEEMKKDGLCPDFVQFDQVFKALKEL